MKTVKIRVPGGGSHKAEVAIDGVEVHGLEAVELRLDVHEPNRVVLHHVGPAADFDGLADVVHIPKRFADRVQAALERLKGISGVMRVPADPTDPDLVLGEVRSMLTRARQVEIGAAKHAWLSLRRLDELEALARQYETSGPVRSTELLALIDEVRKARRDAAEVDEAPV